MSTPHVNGPGQRSTRKRLSLHKDPTQSQTPTKLNSHRGPPIDPAVREAMIRDAAYFRSANRGFAPGSEIQDWLEAEAEVDHEFAGGIAASG